MERLSQHILSLLRLYDSVALPGVGFFKLQYVSARYDASLFLFYPPFFSVSFEIYYMAEDSLLLDSYVRKEQLAKEEARSLMKQDIDNFLDLLEENEEVALTGIGTFVYQDDEIEFYPSFTLNVSLPTLKIEAVEEAQSVGSADVISESVETVEEPSAVLNMEEESEETAEPEEEMPLTETVEEGETQVAPAESSDSLPAEMDEEIINNDEQSAETVKYEFKVPEGYYYHKPEYFYIPVHKAMAKIAACLILVVIVGLTALIPLGFNNNSSGTASIVPINVSDSNGYATTNSDSTESAAKVKVDTAAAANKTERPLLATNDDGEVIPGANSLPTSPYLQDDSGTDKYYAVIAAMKTEREMDNFMDAHKEEIRKFKVIRNRKMKLVTVASSNNKEDLENQLPMIRVDYPNAWIFTMK